MMRMILTGVTALAAVSCQSMPKITEVPSLRPLEVDEPVALTALEEAGLAEGECGMILWTLEGERPTPVLRYIADKQGRISIDNYPHTLTRSKFSGASGFGVFENQTFTSENQFTAKVSFQFGLGFDRGSYIERALISIEADDGWRFVTPAAGIAGCRI